MGPWTNRVSVLIRRGRDTRALCVCMHPGRVTWGHSEGLRREPPLEIYLSRLWSWTSALHTLEKISVGCLVAAQDVRQWKRSDASESRPCPVALPESSCNCPLAPVFLSHPLHAQHTWGLCTWCALCREHRALSSLPDSFFGLFLSAVTEYLLSPNSVLYSQQEEKPLSSNDDLSKGWLQAPGPVWVTAWRHLLWVGGCLKHTVDACKIAQGS